MHNLPPYWTVHLHNLRPHNHDVLPDYMIEKMLDFLHHKHEVFALVHDLFYTINEAGLDTTHARICTEKGVAMDTLYITTSDDKKIEDPATLRALEEKFNSLVARPEI